MNPPNSRTGSAARSGEAATTYRSLSDVDPGAVRVYHLQALRPPGSRLARHPARSFSTGSGRPGQNPHGNFQSQYVHYSPPCASTPCTWKNRLPSSTPTRWMLARRAADGADTKYLSLDMPFIRPDDPVVPIAEHTALFP